MKKFLIKLFVFSLLIFGSFILVLNQGDGYTDAFYVRFTTPKQASLILGTSRAAQGIRPGVLDTIVSGHDFFNFSFTVEDSPYGPIYLRKIKEKLNTDSKNGIFIVTVDPWSISSRSASPNDTTTFRERHGCLAKTEYVSRNPNLPYLVDAFNKHYVKLLTRDPRMFLHDDGWLEVTIDMAPAEVERRTARKILSYTQMMKDYKFSHVRADFLHKTVEYLRKHGTVFLVRLPVGRRITAIEQRFMPKFESKIQRAIAASDGYFDMTSLNAKYRYPDGNHIYRESAIEASAEIGRWILNQLAPQFAIGEPTTTPQAY